MLRILVIGALLMASSLQALTLTSPDFNNNQLLDRQFTGYGANKMPRLSWSNSPQGTKSYALIVDDPDAPDGTWVHWVVFNIPATQTSFDKPLGRSAQRAEGTRQGMTDFKKLGYDGPKPPKGNGPHRYFFKLYALDTLLDLPGGKRTKKEDVVNAMKEHVLAQSQLIGLYEKNS